MKLFSFPRKVAEKNTTLEKRGRHSIRTVARQPALPTTRWECASGGRGAEATVPCTQSQQRQRKTKPEKTKPKHAACTWCPFCIALQKGAQRHLGPPVNQGRNPAGVSAPASPPRPGCGRCGLRMESGQEFRCGLPRVNKYHRTLVGSASGLPGNCFRAWA